MSGSLRENVGKKDAKRLRALEQVPCVLYGGQEQIHFATDSINFKDIVFTPEVCYVNIDLGEQSYRAILQDIQYHPVSDAILHADFLHVHEDKPLIMYIPIQPTGSSKGVIAGGKLVIKLRRIKVKAMPELMPEKIKIDITKLSMNDSVKIRDIKTDNFELLDIPNAVVLGVYATRIALTAEEIAEEEAEEAEAAEAAEAALAAEGDAGAAAEAKA